MQVTETHRDICASFLQLVRAIGTSGDNIEGVEVAEECLKNIFQINSINEYEKKNLPSIEQVWARGTNTPLSSEAAGSLGGNEGNKEDDNDPKLHEFLLMAKQRGFFNGVEEGSPQYLARLERAKAKFYARQNPYEGLTAEQLKTKGNELMSQGKHKEAVGYYTKATELEPTNHIFHANRAAANIHLEEYKTAISDCEKAIAINPSYPKAFSRLGTACFYEKRYERAADAYRRALELDPDNQTYKDDLEAAEQKLQSEQSQTAASNPFANLMGGGFPGFGPGGMDMSSMMNMMNNPQFMQLANSFLQNPEFSNVVQSFAQQMGMQAPNPNEITDFLQNISSGDQEKLHDAQDPDTLVTPFGRIDKEMLQRIQEEEIKNNPQMAAIVEDVRANGPAVFSKYMGDPEVMRIMSKFVSSLTPKPPLGNENSSSNNKNDHDNEPDGMSSY